MAVIKYKVALRVFKQQKPYHIAHTKIRDKNSKLNSKITAAFAMIISLNEYERIMTIRSCPDRYSSVTTSVIKLRTWH